MNKQQKTIRMTTTANVYNGMMESGIVPEPSIRSQYNEKVGSRLTGCMYYDNTSQRIETIQENRLVNCEFLKWINEAAYNQKTIYWKCENITTYDKRKWYILFVYADDCVMDPLFQWMTAGRMYIPNIYGTAYVFQRLAIRNACVDILKHLVDVSSSQVVPFPIICHIIQPVDDGDKIACKCGGRYDINRYEDHFNTHKHNRWIATLKELMSDDV